MLALADSPLVETTTLRRRFFGWQCRLRQIAMRQHEGRPQPGMMPNPVIRDRPHPAITVILVRRAEDTYLSELQHIVRRTHDPEQRRKDALKLFQEHYYQDTDSFEDVLCALFQPDSHYAETLIASGDFALDFRAYQQSCRLRVSARAVEPQEHLFQETYWHNVLFNPAVAPDSRVLVLRPDWMASTAEI